MSWRELAEHAMLLEYRSLSPDDVTLLEFSWRPGFDATLVHHAWLYNFNWTSLDSNISGMANLIPDSDDDLDWIRHFCSTFRADGNPLDPSALDDSQLNLLVQISDVAGK
jgi:hypothetical protein